MMWITTFFLKKKKTPHNQTLMLHPHLNSLKSFTSYLPDSEAEVKDADHSRLKKKKPPPKKQQKKPQTKSQKTQYCYPFGFVR